MPEGTVARAFRQRAPLFAAFFGRATDAVDRALFVAVVSLAMAASLCGGDAFHSVPAALIALLTAAQLALFVWALARLLRFVTRGGLDAMGFALAAALLSAALGIDRLHVAFFHQHVSVAVVREAFEAVRAGAIPVSGAAVGMGLLALAVLFVALASFLKGLSFLPRTRAADAVVRAVAVPALLVVGTLGSVRECALDPPSPATVDVRRATPWDAVAHWPATALSPSDEHVRTATLFGERRLFDDLQTARDAIAANPPQARVRPDIVIVHVESLRADMLRADVAPRMTAFAPECLTAPMHYTTGTNTGTGVFGLLNGLTSPFYPLARAAHARPIPLQVLRALGYDLSVYFISNFGTYDGLFDLYFQDLAGYRYAGPEEPVWDADGKMVDAWIARLRAAPGNAPRFDYVVLDSTHYDYSYPPGFEKFTPQMTLDLVKDVKVTEEGINEKLKWRAPFVRNRYQNSVLYADSLVGKMIDALRETGRLEHTIVVVTGDHGEEFWEHGSFGHGFFGLPNEQTRVPFLMRVPASVASGTSHYRYSSHADVFPTIFDAIGARGLPRFMNGKSLLAWDASLDLALVGFGVTGTATDPRMAVVGDGLKVAWNDAPPFATLAVTTDTDDVIADVPTGRALDLVVRALANESLR